MNTNKTLNEKMKLALSLLDESIQEIERVEKPVQDQKMKELILQLMEENTTYSNQLMSNLEKEIIPFES